MKLLVQIFIVDGFSAKICETNEFIYAAWLIYASVNGAIIKLINAL